MVYGNGLRPPLRVRVWDSLSGHGPETGERRDPSDVNGRTEERGDHGLDRTTTGPDTPPFPVTVPTGDVRTFPSHKTIRTSSEKFRTQLPVPLIPPVPESQKHPIFTHGTPVLLPKGR